MITISEDVTVTSLGVVAQSETGAQGILALYSNVGGAPSALLAQTISATINAGVNQISLTSSVDVPAGTYWIAGEYNETAAICIDDSNTNEIQIVGIASYGSVPSMFGDPMHTVFGENVNYYVVGVLP
jgi:hypothetical protein